MSSTMIKKAAAIGMTYRYHYWHKKMASNILRSIEQQRGETDITLKKRCDEYAREVLKGSWFAPWLYVYSAIASEFREGWIPDNYYGHVVVPAIKGNHGNISKLKSLSKLLFQTNLFPDQATYINGLWFDSDRNIIPSQKIIDHLFHDQERIVFKPDGGHQGKGIIIFKKADFNPILVEREGNGVLQSYIQQHPFFDAIMPDSVITLRMTTVSEQSGRCSLRAAYLRTGRKSETHVASASHVRVPVSTTGILSSNGFLANWHFVTKHPDTGFIFEDQMIPEFEKCVTVTLKLHKKVPFIRSIGWDVVVDKDCNVKIMEWNGNHNDIKFSEATQGPCFADMGWEKLRSH